MSKINTTRKPFTMKPDGARTLGSDAKSKPFVLEINWAGCSEASLQAIATRQIVVDFVNGNRKDYAKYEEGHTFKVNAIDFIPKSDPLTVLSQMSPEDRLEFLKNSGLLEGISLGK